MKYENTYKLCRAVELSYLNYAISSLKERLEKGEKIYSCSLLTDDALNKFSKGIISKEDLLKKAEKSFQRKLKKETDKLVSLLQNIENTPDFEGSKIEVGWVRSNTWGMNPHAKVTIYREDSFRGCASGCGYDKLSASVASALNQSLSVKKLFIEKVLEPLTEKWLKEGKTIEELAKDYGYRQFFPYGTGYYPITFFEGGVGVNCYTSIFALAGYDFKQIASGKTYDVFTIEKTR